MKAILSIKLCCLIFALLILISSSVVNIALSINMDVKCTVYEHSDEENGDNVDLRILVLGLKPNSEYTARVIPDHNLPSSVNIKTDYEGIFWTVAKIPNGENSLLFKVDIYEGNDTNASVVAAGDDDAPCYPIQFKK